MYQRREITLKRLIFLFYSKIIVSAGLYSYVHARAMCLCVSGYVEFSYDETLKSHYIPSTPPL